MGKKKPISQMSSTLREPGNTVGKRGKNGGIKTEHRNEKQGGKEEK